MSVFKDFVVLENLDKQVKPCYRKGECATPAVHRRMLVIRRHHP